MTCYAAYAKDNKTRMLGSSGGYFPLTANKFIENGGIVYGSVYNSDLSVSIARIDSLDEIGKSFTSKYMQSRPEDSFVKLREDLKKGNKVLFCSSPCYVRGLKRFLSASNVSTENLLLIDFVCHGVPNEDVFLKCIGKYNDPKCVSLNMRNKESGWNWGGFSWKYTFDDESERLIPQQDVPFMKGFLNNLYLRPSCHYCSAKKDSAADITIGDFWGITDVDKSIDTKGGVSCVIVRTEKGKAEFDFVKHELEYKEVRYSDIVNGNYALENSVRIPHGRAIFFARQKKAKDVEQLINKLCSRTFTYRVLRKVYTFLPQKSFGVSELHNEESGPFFTAKEKCCGCTACLSICPKQAISMKKDKEGFFYAVIDSQKCIDCGLCKKVCPCI